MTAEVYMRAALDVAREGMAQGNLPIGAVLVLNDSIISTAHTAEISAGRLLVHAEMSALWAADQLRPFPGKRREVILFTTLEPCLMCLGAAMSFCIGEIYYALESPADGAVQMTQHWQRREEQMPSYRLPHIHGGLLRAESKALFADYVRRHTEGELWEWAKTLVALPQ